MKMEYDYFSICICINLKHRHIIFCNFSMELLFPLYHHWLELQNSQPDDGCHSMVEVQTTKYLLKYPVL